MEENYENQIKQLLSKDKNVKIEYQGIKLMHKIVNEHGKAINSTLFEKLFFSVSPELKQLLLFEDLNYRIWLNDTSPANLRQKTRFFVIVFDWIVKFEMRVGKLDSYKAQFELILDFLREHSKTIFERMILLEEVHEDLKQLIPTLYNEEQLIISEDHPPELMGKPISAESANTILAFLREVITYGVVMIDQTDDLYLNIIRQQVGPLKNYTDFLSKCIYLLLSCCETFDNSLQTDLTRIILIFLHRQLPANTTIGFIKSLMVKTNKPVRFALLVQYIQFYHFLEHMNNEIVLQQLENIVHFRELIIGHNDLQEKQTIKQPLCSIEKQICVKARSKEKIFFSRESQQENLLKFQIYIEQGDINIRIFYFEEKEEVLYWEEEKSGSKRVELILKHPGLYALELDNSYSWINGKHISYRIDQFVKVLPEKSEH